MNKITRNISIIAIGLILFLLWLSVLDIKEGELFSGLLILYGSSIALFKGLRKEKVTMHGLRFRAIFVGVIGIIGGLVIVISYFIKGA